MASHFAFLCQPYFGKQRTWHLGQFLQVVETLWVSIRERTQIPLLNQHIFMEFLVSARHCSRHWGYSNERDEDPALVELTFFYGRLNEQIHK